MLQYQLGDLDLCFSIDICGHKLRANRDTMKKENNIHNLILLTNIQYLYPGIISFAFVSINLG